jgi:hypothetical protein
MNLRYTTKIFDAMKRISDAQMTLIEKLLRPETSSITSQSWHFVIVGIETVGCGRDEN